MGKSIFIDIWTNYLGKSKQLNYTAQPSANYYLSVEISTSHLYVAIYKAHLWGPNSHCDSGKYHCYYYHCYYCYSAYRWEGTWQLKDMLKVTLLARDHAGTASRLFCFSQPGFFPLHLAFSMGHGTVTPGVKTGSWRSKILSLLTYKAQMYIHYINR